MDSEDALIIDENYSGTEQRNIWQRTFSPIKHGGIRGSVFNLCCIAIGAGIHFIRLPHTPICHVQMWLNSRLDFTGARIVYWILELKQPGAHF